MQSGETLTPLGLAGRIVEALSEHAAAATVEDVRIGLGYTAVRLADGGTGVALTFREEAGATCSPFDAAGPLAGRRATDLLGLLGSNDVIGSAVGLACANALANRLDSTADLRPGDMQGLLDLRPDDRVAMVGHFHPMVDPIRQRVRELIIFERIQTPQGELRPADEAPDVLPDCDVALITATTIINGTIDRLLKPAAGCREVVVAGASTPLAPDLFVHTPVTMLSGVVVTDPPGLLQVVSEGGGMRAFKPFIRKVNVRVAGRT